METIQTQRFCYENYLEDAILTPADQMTGIVSGAVPQRLGVGETASLLTWGAYTGQTELIYTLEARLVAGAAVYRWRESSQPLGSWKYQDVPCHTTYQELEAGIYVKFTALPTQGGLWQFRAMPSFSIQNAVARDRRTYYKTPDGVLTTVITADLGAAQHIQAHILYDHNLSAAATVTLKGNPTDSGWATPAYSLVLDPDALMTYLDQTYRYWRLELADEGNPDNLLVIGEWFLGPYLEFATQVDWENAWALQYHTITSISDAGLPQSSVLSEQREFTLEFPARLEPDVTALLTMLAAVHESATQRKRPVFFHERLDDPARLYLCHLQERTPFTLDAVDRTTFTIALQELPKLYV